MKCSRCGAENAPGSVVCAACGTPLASATPVAPVAPVYVAKPVVPGKGLAIASLVCGIVSFFCFGFILGVLAAIFGGVSIAKAKQVGMKPSGMAIAGMVLGIIGLACYVIMIISCGSMIPFMA